MKGNINITPGLDGVIVRWPTTWTILTKLMLVLDMSTPTKANKRIALRYIRVGINCSDVRSGLAQHRT